jgi:hypothetical protein
MRLLPMLATCAVVLQVTSTSFGQASPSKEEVVKRYQEGISLYDRGQYEAAYVRFAEANAVAQTPPILFNLARTEQLTGRLVDASRHFKEYLALPTHPKITADLRKQASTFQDQLHAELGHIVVDAPTGTLLSVDDKAVPTEGTIDITAGTHTIVAKLGPVTRTMTLACPAGITTNAKFDFDDSKEAPPPSIGSPAPPPPSPVAAAPRIEGGDAGPQKEGAPGFWTAKHITLIGLGVGVVAAGVVGGAFFADAGSADSEAKSLTNDESCAGSNSPACAQAGQLKSRYDNDQVSGGVAFGVGGALLVSGVVVLLAWPEAAKRSAWVTPMGGPGFAGVGVRGSF